MIDILILCQLFLLWCWRILIAGFLCVCQHCTEASHTGHKPTTGLLSTCGIQISLLVNTPLSTGLKSCRVELHCWVRMTGSGKHLALSDPLVGGQDINTKTIVTDSNEDKEYSEDGKSNSEFFLQLQIIQKLLKKNLRK